MMIEKQREKEFLFELEQLYHKYNLVIIGDDGWHCAIRLGEADYEDTDQTTTIIEHTVDYLRVRTLEEER